MPSARIIFYVHALVVIGVILAAYVGPIDPDYTIPPLLLASLILPLVVLVVALIEKQSPGRTAAAVALSIVLTISSFYAILPLVM